MAETLHAHVDLGPPESVTGYIMHDPAAGDIDAQRVRPVDDRQPAYNPATHVKGERIETIEPTQVVWQYPVAERPLADVQLDLCARVDGIAGDLRNAYTTAISGQPETYTRKSFEAQAVKDDPAPTTESYPLLAAGIGSDVPDNGPDEIANDLRAAGVVVETRAKEWAQQNRPVETPRLKGKRDIEAAQTVTEAWTAFQAIEWPTLESLVADDTRRRQRARPSRA